MTGRTLLKLLIELRTLFPGKLDITEKPSNVPSRIFKGIVLSSYQAPDGQEWFHFFQHYFRKIWYIFAFIQFTVLIVTYNLLIYFIKENSLRGIFEQNLCAVMYVYM